MLVLGIGNMIERIDKFLDPGGLRHLMFYYQDVEATDMEHFSFPGINSHLTKKKKPKVFVTEGKEVALTGVCVFFIRSSVLKAITAENIYQEVNFNMMDVGRDGLLKSVEQLILEIFIPALQITDYGWAGLGEHQQNDNIKKEFLTSLESFVSVLSGTQQSLLEKISLKKCATYDLKSLKGPADYLMVANNTDDLERIEVCMKEWTKQIQQNWRALDIRITDAVNEAKDNVRYLYSLEKHCDPLYNTDPVSMVDAIPGLINAIQMIQSVSLYYNTSEKISSLFVKVTTQMITACKSYITNNDTATIWNQPADSVMEKLHAAIRLKQEYQNCFHNMKRNLEQNPAERQFDFSEVYIFGKFETFNRRLEKIIDVFNTMRTYSVLQESKIEGLEEMIAKYESIVDIMKKKDYNFLDQRKADFDRDYEEFCKEINDLRNQLKTFMDDTFENIPNTERALCMLKKFE
ncbi:hypothetical protein CIB84_006969, partial [Bambusicola thoracicus]